LALIVFSWLLALVRLGFPWLSAHADLGFSWLFRTAILAFVGFPAAPTIEVHTSKRRERARTARRPRPDSDLTAA
jgi:hypothetical protein